MSRILDALAKAQQGGAPPEVRVPPGGGARTPERVARRERLATPERDRLELPVVRQLPDRTLAVARFTPEAFAVLARSYESVERCCAIDRGLVLGPEARPARVLLVGTRGTGARTAAGALALAATLAEKTRSRVVLADADSAGALARLCLPEPGGSPGLRELGANPGELEACVRRTQLADLYVVPAGSASPPAEWTQGAGLRHAVETLSAYFPFVVLHAGPLEPNGDGAGASALVSLAEAVLLTDREPEPGEPGRALPVARNLPVRFLSEFAQEPA